MTARGLQVLAVSLLLLGGARGLSDWVYDRAANQKAAQLIAAANNGTSHIAPSTTKPSQTAFEDYTVPALNPRYIYIPRLNITAIVRRLGTTPDNEIATPDNVYDAGWYQGSSRPGQPGAMIVDGHVSSWTTHGVFYGLDALRPGDDIHITRGNGSVVTYTVVKSMTYPADKVDMATVLTPVTKTRPGLSLITCTGDIIPGTNDFNKRIVVFASLAS